MGDSSIWYESVFEKILLDVDYIGEPGNEDRQDPNYDPYGDAPAFWEDPMFIVVLGTGIAIVVLVGIAIYFIRRRAQREVVEVLTKKDNSGGDLKSYHRES